MGLVASSDLSRDEIEEHTRKTHFNEEEVCVVYEHFKNISSTVRDDGLIDKREFQKAMQMKRSVYLDRIFRLFDINGDGVINFSEFIHGLSVLSAQGTAEEKLKFSFMLYDQDCDNRISVNELTEMLRATVAESNLELSGEAMDALVERTFDAAKVSEPGFVNFDEYKRLVRRNAAFVNDLSINVHGRIHEEMARRRQ